VNGDYLYRLFRRMGLSDFGADTARVLVRPLEVLLVLAVALVVSRALAKVVRRSVTGLVARSTFHSESPERTASRAATLAGVAANVVRIAVWTVALLVVIDKVGINPGPVLAGASIVGIALGFGAQSLVKDFLSGFFVLAEDQFAVGDVVTVVDVTGTVEEVNLRTTRLRADDGTVWFVPNGEIRKVGNSAKDWSRAVLDVSLPPGADMTVAESVIADVVSAMAQEPAWSSVVLEAHVLGVESMGPDGFTIRVSAKTVPAQRTRVTRELRVRIGARLRREGIVPLRQAVVPSADSSGGGASAPE
jgi:moderate conductance mechanosensitive channel